MPSNSTKRARHQRIEADFAAWASAPDAIDELCEAVSKTAYSTLSAWCATKGFTRFAVRTWIGADIVRAALFELAIRQRADLMADRAIELSKEPLERKNGRVDPLALEHRRLQIQTLQFLAAQSHPRAYGG